MHEWLQLVAWMGWCPPDTEHTLDWLFFQDWVAESVSDVGELLLVRPLHVVLAATVVVVVGSGWGVLLLVLEVQFLSLGEPGAGWLSPPVVVLEESIIKMSIESLGALNLIKAFWHIRHLI